MYCNKCGRQINDGEKFCIKCGEPIPVLQNAEIISSGKKRSWPMGIVVVILALVLILQNLSIIPVITDSGSNSQNNIEMGYATPEETINKFGEAISNNDMNGALSLFACRHMTDNYDYKAYVEKHQVWLPVANYSYPAPEGIFRESIYEKLKGEAARQIFNVCFSLKADSKYLEMKPVEDLKQTITDLEEITDLDQLDSFRILRMDYTKPEIQNTSTHQNNAATYCKIYGAEDRVEYSIFYEYGGETYFGGMNLIQYEQKWYIENLIGTLAGQSGYAYLEPMNESEYCEIAGV